MSTISIPPLLLLSLCLSACVSQDFKTYDRYLASKNIPAPTVEQFPHCHAYGCASHYLVELNKSQWKQIDKIFARPSKNAAQERERIIKAVGLFERMVGGMTGTDADVKGTFRKTGENQLDCVDESTNTTIYLDLLKQRGHLTFHDIEQPQIRLPFVGGGAWIHQTAVMRERESGIDYAVDSWFYDNGIEPVIVPLEDWRKGWKPEGWSELG